MVSISYTTPQEWARTAAQAIAEHLSTGLRERGEASLVVPGGRSATAILPPLAHHSLNWQNVAVTLTDERWVPPDHPDSNEGLVRTHLLGNGAPARIVALKTDAPAPQAGLAAASARLAEIARPFDVVFLGMGEDGHIASLFPGGTVDETGDLQAATHRDHPRISMTPSCLLQSRLIVLPISGDRKKQVFEAAMEPGASSTLPVRHVLHQSETPVLAILD